MFLMKISTTVWTLAWDDTDGTDCLFFAGEAECMDHLRALITGKISGSNIEEADQIRRLLTIRDFGAAYELWQENFNVDSETYNWGPQALEIESESAIA